MEYTTMTAPTLPNTAPVHLKANEVSEVTIRCISTIEIIKLEDIEEPVWVRFDKKDPVEYTAGSFIVFDAREYNINRSRVTVRLLCRVDCWVTVEGATF